MKARGNHRQNLSKSSPEWGTIKRRACAPSFVFGLHRTMIVTEPAIGKKFGRAAFSRRRLAQFLAEAKKAAPLEGTVSVLLTDDKEIQRLNREFRHKDKPTDVLSFPAGEVSGRSRVAGDLAISVETAAREAEARGHALALELEVLILHGVLHLAGYDHEIDTGQMARKEERLRKQLGLAEGLIARTIGSKTAAKKRGQKR
jgi:probable rRNA maturation factor